MYQHILVPTDGSALSNQALAKAFKFAKEADAKVTVLTVVEPFKIFSTDPDQVESSHVEYDRHAEEAANQILALSKGTAEAEGISCAIVRARGSDPAAAITEAADSNGCDLIAMASHGREGFKAFLIGSVTMKVLATTKLPVLVYR